MATIVSEVLEKDERTTTQRIEDYILDEAPILSHVLFGALRSKGMAKKTVQTVISEMIRDKLIEKKSYLKDMRSYTVVISK